MKISRLTAMNFARFFAVVLFLAAGLSLNAQVIYDNGGLATGATSRSGVSAPAGTQWSEAQSNAGSTTESNTTAGVGCNLIGTTTNNRCADDFQVPPGESWTVTSVTTFAYQTGAPGPASPFVAANLQIWRGRPGEVGSVVVFGDTTTNRLGTSTNSNLFRVFNTTTPAPGTAPGTTRIIWQNTINVSPAAVLTPGNYWIDWQTDAGAAGNFSPPANILNNRGTPVMNARQKIATAAFVDIIDAGNPAASADYLQDFPFKINGSITGSIGPRRSRTIDFNGDNKTDFAIARAAGASAQTLWAIQDSANATSFTNFGLGVGFSGGDRAVPEDYDGDGKTDIAVWRPAAAPNAFFYVLQSSTNTLLSRELGATGDDPSVIDDYDGDGKADMAVYRSAAQSFYYYRGSLNPNIITFVPWGTTGDKPVPGDYDGDRKADPAVVRDVAGNAVHYQNRSTDGFRAVQFGLISDNYAQGDYDGDNKTDICAVRVSGATYAWFVLRSGDGTLMSTTLQNGYAASATDYIAQGDYDGDNKTDFAVWRSGTGGDAGTFFMNPSASALSQTKWGISAGAFTPGDYPVANYNVH